MTTFLQLGVYILVFRNFRQLLTFALSVFCSFGKVFLVVIVRLPSPSSQSCGKYSSFISVVVFWISSQLVRTDA